MPWFSTTTRTNLFILRDERDLSSLMRRIWALLCSIHKPFFGGMQCKAFTNRAHLNSLVYCRNGRAVSENLHQYVTVFIETPLGGAV